VLDGKSFEALASKTRVQLLKSLKKRKKTLTELSSESLLSVSGVKEHLDNLEKAELIRKIDDGHKWKYYELTKKGMAIVSPNLTKVYVLLAISLSIFLYSVFMFGSPFQGAAAPQLVAGGIHEKTAYTTDLDADPTNPVLANSLNESGSAKSESSSLLAASGQRSDDSASELFSISLLAASGLISIACILYIIHSNYGLLGRTPISKLYR